MTAQENNGRPEEVETTSSNEMAQAENVANTDDAIEDDGAPALDEIDLEENDLTVEEADTIEWDDSK